MKLAHDTIILVVDGARMVLLRNHGDAVQPDLRVAEHRQIEIPENRDILSDAPGVDMSRGYPGRSTLDQGDPHRAYEDQFIAGAMSRRPPQAACRKPALRERVGPACMDCRRGWK